MRLRSGECARCCRPMPCPYRKLDPAGAIAANRATVQSMGDVLKLIWWAVIALFRSRASLEAEILALRQLTVLRRKAPKRLAFNTFDRLFFARLYRIAPGIVNALVIVQPETVIRWHRAGFRLFWRWKLRHRGGRPKVPLEIRQLIRDMSLAYPLWGAPRIHGELLKLGIDVGQTSVAKGGRRSFPTTPMGSPQWISSSFRHSRFDCFTACSFYATAGAGSYGSA